MSTVKGWLNGLDEWANRHRPWALLAMVGLTLAIVGICDWLTGADLFDQLLYPDRMTVAQVRFWSALVYALALVMGLPVAFLLWHWRDRNVRDQIEEQRRQVENARKDTNLKEFQEVQRQAAGLFDKDLPQEARETLQIAALHQLRGFLRGDYGEAFKRPAFELLLAGHAQAMERIGLARVVDQAIIVHGNTEALSESIDEAIGNARKKLTMVDSARIRIIADEWHLIIGSKFPMNGRCFDFIDLQNTKVPEGLDFSGSSWKGGGVSP